MTYCLGIVTKEGLVMAGDSRTNAGNDQVFAVRKLITFCKPGERAFMLLSAGSLSCSQSIMTLLKREFDKGEGLADAETMYDAARAVCEILRKVAKMDRDEFAFRAASLAWDTAHRFRRFALPPLLA